MNQILVIEDKKRKRNKKLNSGPIEIRSITRFFALALMAFGLFFIGQGSYAMYRDSIVKNTNNLPTVSISRVNDKVIVTVDSINKIENLKYSWNNAEEMVIPVDDTFIEEEIILPVENSILKVVVEEESGRNISYSKEYNIEGLDINEPIITIAEESTPGNIKITAKDETQMAYITYKVNDEEEVKIDKSDMEDKTMNYILKLQKGENHIVITASDTLGNIAKLEKKIIVTGKTTINFELDKNNLTIRIKDPDGIKDIRVNLNGVNYSAKDLNKKAVKVPLKLKEGINTISVTVVNVNSLETVEVKEFNYAQ